LAQKENPQKALLFLLEIQGVPAQRTAIPLEVCIADCHAAVHKPTGLISWQSMRVLFYAASLAFHGI